MPRLTRICGHTFVANWMPAAPAIIDLGMNEGSFSRQLAGLYPGARIHGCEPVPALYQALARSFGDRVRNVAVGGRSGQEKVRIYDNYCASLVFDSLEPDADAAPITILSLDDFFDGLGLARVDLLKVDIEGAELEMFKNASARALSMCDQITVEYHDFLDRGQIADIKACTARLKALGFRAYRCSILNRSDVLYVHERLAGSLPAHLAIHAAVAGRHFTVRKFRNFVQHVRNAGRPNLAPAGNNV